MTALIIIVAYSRNRVIGKDNQLPWRLPSDLAHFKRQTSGYPIIMGRKTWESLGRPLPNRHNIVISRQGVGDFTGATLVGSLEEAVAAAGLVEQAFIIGGAQLYAQALPLVHEVMATEVDADVQGDAFFAPLPQAEWVEYSREGQAPENGLPFSFVTYRRIA
jgi:dihydrofolate reductase